ncbi:unnamed protein product [Periconia digitata]|uniref:Uncharacterized protein n=1 Tax=Periconia digitata TaxID=1303443 RepID=A0A9W4UHF1_9PLEO|nr:unnamed protein product [Periconia digitata]
MTSSCELGILQSLPLRRESPLSTALTCSDIPVPASMSPTSSSPSETSSQRRILEFTDDTSQSRRNFRSCIYQFLRVLGLSAVYNLLAKKCNWPVSEKKKVVIRKDKLKATLQCVVHLVPLSAALALLVLNRSNYYISSELSGAPGQDTQKLAALLFAAKLHELFMLASLSTIAITHIQKELVFGAEYHSVLSSQQHNSKTLPFCSRQNYKRPFIMNGKRDERSGSLYPCSSFARLQD